MKAAHYHSGRGHKGYGSPPFCWNNPRARKFSNAPLLLVVGLLGLGVSLLTWALLLAQGQP